MNFVSFSFLLLFGGTLLGRWILGPRKNEAAYLALLLAASLLFYAWHVPAYLSILLASTCVDYSAGLALGSTSATRARRAILVVSLTMNLGLLFFFKYTNFFFGELEALLAALGWKTDLPGLNLILPMGISFYTFQSMSYTIDVYRGHLAPYRSFWKFLLFVSFFPQLMAGPIVRAQEFLYQIDRPRRIVAPVLLEGSYLAIRGFFLKMVCADNLGTIIDRHWEAAVAPGAGAGLAAAMAVLYGFRIFCDFEGYSSIARGLAYMLGFRLPENFNSPYLACSYREFWTRWHMTLGRWLRDYLYIPLGGNRGGPWRALRNLFLVMFLGGLWHGATAPMVLWGTFHGLFLGLERWLGKAQPAGALAKLGGWVLTQLGVFFLWLFFVSPTTAELKGLLGNLAGLAWGGLQALPLITAGLLLLPPVLIHARRFLFERFAVPQPGPRERAASAALMLYGTLTCFGKSGAFIYFQF